MFTFTFIDHLTFIEHFILKNILKHLNHLIVELIYIGRSMRVSRWGD